LEGGVTALFRGFVGGGVGVLDTIAGDFTTGMKEDALGLSLGLGVVDVIGSLFVGVSFREITVELERLDFAKGGVGGLFVGRAPTVRGIEELRLNCGGGWR
jgi:hypothetical protein